MNFMRLVFAGALACLAACDPGWQYIEPSAHSMAGGPSSTSVDTSGVTLKASGSLFCSSLRITVAITNDDDAPIEVRDEPLRVTNAKLHPLAWRSGLTPLGPCSNRGGDVVTLRRGEVCEVRRTLEVAPLVGFRRNPDLEHVTVTVDGISRQGTPLSRSVRLEWD